MHAIGFAKINDYAFFDVSAKRNWFSFVRWLLCPLKI